MKRYINASKHTLQFSHRGSAPDSRNYIKNNGWLIPIPNKPNAYLVYYTSKVLIDKDTGKTYPYIDFSLEYSGDDIRYTVPFIKYTPQEFEQLYSYLTSLSLEDFMHEIEQYAQSFGDIQFRRRISL